jgi:DNA-nicking Smr family endonuclease
MKTHSLQDLKALKDQIAAEHTREAQAREQRTRDERRQRANHAVFAEAMQGVQPIHVPTRVTRRPPAPQPIPHQRQRDDAAVLHESLSDEFDTSTLLSVNGLLSFSRAGIGPDVAHKLRRGDWTIQAQIDLHGLRREEAREALSTFLHQAQAGGLRCVRVVHGKGLGSPGGVPVLKSKVHGWLIQKKEVLAFTQAKPTQGGAGALLVLLAPPPHATHAKP